MSEASSAKVPSRYSKKFWDAFSRIGDDGADKLSENFVKQMRLLGWEERLKHLYRIKDKDTGRFVFFQPNKAQLKFLAEKKNRNLILKARQQGFTTLACVYSLDRAMWDGWSTGIMSHKKEHTAKIFEIVRNANDWFRKDWGHLYAPEQSSDSANQISFKDTKATITVAFDFRGLTCHYLHVSEAAFIDTERLTNSLQSVPEKGEVVLESTPNGFGGFFFNQWQLFREKGPLAPYQGHFFPWFFHYPEHPQDWLDKCDFELNDTEVELKNLYSLEKYHLAWRRWKIDESCDGKSEIFEVEYPSNDIECFLGRHSLVYSRETIKYQEAFVKEPAFIGNLRTQGKTVEFHADKRGLIQIWELPKAGEEFAIGVDSSSGVSTDPSAVCVINRKTGAQVARLRALISPDELAEEVWKLGHFYNHAWVCPEANNHGYTVIHVLRQLGYTRIYRRRTIDKMIDQQKQELGFLTTRASKVPLIDKHVAACREGQFRTRSQDLVNEYKTFVQVNSETNRTMRREALPECHDDEIIAACLAWEMHLSRAMASPNEPDLPDIYREHSVDPETGMLSQDNGPYNQTVLNRFDPLEML